MAATPQSAELIQETLSSERRRVTVLAQVFGVAALVKAGADDKAR